MQCGTSALAWEPHGHRMVIAEAGSDSQVGPRMPFSCELLTSLHARPGIGHADLHDVQWTCARWGGVTTVSQLSSGQCCAAYRSVMSLPCDFARLHGIVGLGHLDQQAIAASWLPLIDTNATEQTQAPDRTRAQVVELSLCHTLAHAHRIGAVHDAGLPGGPSPEVHLLLVCPMEALARLVLQLNLACRRVCSAENP